MMGPRPAKGFVGLKNAGATCYMNSVIQQLFMVPAIQGQVISLPKEKLSLPQTSTDEVEGEGKEKKQDPPHEVQNIDFERRAYHISVLAEMQAIFGHLSLSKLQYYTPQGFWKAFKLWGEPVNLKEQQDGVEFYNCIVDSLDQGTKFIFGKRFYFSNISLSIKVDFFCPKISKNYELFFLTNSQLTEECPTVPVWYKEKGPFSL